MKTKEPNDMTTQEEIKNVLLMKRNELNSHKVHREDIAIEKNSETLDDIQQGADRVIVLDSLNRNWSTNTLISQALERIADGSYGTCMDCEEEISPKRLAALPWAKYCIKCQEKADRATTEMRWDAAA